MGRVRRRRTTRTSIEADPETVLLGSAAVRGHVRSDELMARESRNMLDELKRVAGVSAVCFGLLIALAVVERLS